MRSSHYNLALGSGLLALLATGVIPQALAAEPDLAGQAAKPAAAPGNAIEEVVITATRTGASSAQKTPVAITALSGDALNSNMAINVKDLVQMVPNMNVAKTTASAQIYIRGVGSNNVFNGSDPDVTVQSDGVYIARAYSQFADFVDIERLEVLRGPQGTLYGRNAVGGTVNIVSRQPTDAFEGRLQQTFGNYNLLQTQGYVSGPLAPGVAEASLAVNYIRHDPYAANIVPGYPGVGDANRGGFRGQLRLHPSSAVEAITRFDWNTSDERWDSYSHLLALSPASPLATSIIGDYRKVALNTDQRIKTKIYGVSEEVNVDLAPAFKLKSITALRHSRFDLAVDSDNTELLSQTSIQWDQARQFSQEFDLNYSGDKLKAIGGLYYFEEEETSLNSVSTPPSAVTPAERSSRTNAAPYSKTRSYAVFGQGTYRLSDRLGMTAGVRFTHDTKDFRQQLDRNAIPAYPVIGPALPPFPFAASVSRKFNSITPKLAVDYALTGSALLYASATKGYKSGGNNFAASSPQTLSFDPETIWAYEAGLKSEWFSRRLRVNVTGFYYDYSQLQVQALISAGIVGINNAANARIRGLELETVAKPVTGLTLTANLSLLDAQYVKYAAASVPTAIKPLFAADPRYAAASGTYDATGQQLNAAPKSSASLSAQYDFELGGKNLFVRGQYYHQARAYYDPSNIQILSQAPYGLTDLAVGYMSNDGLWRAQLMAKNVSNTQYLIVAAANGFVPSGLPGAPRTIALQIGRSW